MHFWKMLDQLRMHIRCGRIRERDHVLRKLYIEAISPHELKAQRLNILAEYVARYGISRPRIFIDAQHGLCNRLRAIASAASIAEAIGYELVVVWEPDFHCECEFHDLFENDIPALGESFINRARRDGLITFNYMEIEPYSDRSAEIILNDGASAYIRSAYTLNSPYSDSRRATTFLRQLKPVPEILRLADSIDVRGRLGAHVRMEAGEGLDNNIYDSRVNWPAYGHEALHYWRAKSHFSRFIERIDTILKYNSSFQLFLATDRQQTYQVFKNYYGDKLAFLHRSAYDRSKQQISYALADLILLSRCSIFLGSTYSSFSELAPRLSMRPMSIEMSGKDF